MKEQMTGMKIHKVMLALLLCATSVGAAEFKVANVFQDHMVLQREQAVNYRRTAVRYGVSNDAVAIDGGCFAHSASQVAAAIE